LLLQLVCRRRPKAGCQKSISNAALSFEITADCAAWSRLQIARNENDEIRGKTWIGLHSKWVLQDERREVSPKSKDQAAGSRTSITRAALELAIAEAVRSGSPECSALIGIIVERVVPSAPGSANWAVKGIRFGKADRDQCGAAISKIVEERQLEFELSD
jgi:hypothetical protein